MTTRKVWTRVPRGSFPWYPSREGTSNLPTTEQNEHPQSLQRMGGGVDERLEPADLMTWITPRIMRRTPDGGKAEAKCTCGKVCKNIRGLKIHQARSRCGIVTPQTTEKFLKTLIKFTKELLVKKDQGHFTLERHKLRPTERRATGSMPKRGESGFTRGVDGCE